MKGKTFKRLTAGVMSAAMAVTASAQAVFASPVMAADDTAVSGKVIYSTDFEDGDVSYFTNRGENDTTELSASTDVAKSGTTALLASGRSKEWNGPAFRLDTVCEPNTEYYISASIRGKYYTGATFSFQYTDADGGVHYSNLVQNLSGSDWIDLENVKVSFTEDMTDVYVYFEGGTDDIYLDDFSVVEVPVTPIEDLPSIASAFANDFKVGTAITPDNLSSKSFMALVEKHFNASITVGNEMKPDSVLDQAACLAYVEEHDGDDTVPQVSFAKAKSILNYCQKNNIPVRVHTLVWHSQTPDWFFKEGYQADGDWVTPEKMLKRMENYIKNYFETLTALYPDVNFYACDVVNEAWLEGGTPREAGEQGQSGSAKSAWVSVFGDNSFIEYAFTYARKYAPAGCKLYYNDYNEYMDGKMNAIIDMAKSLKEKGLIDGIGMQSHLDVRQSLDAAFPSVNIYNRALDKYCELGLDIQITELDATIPENSGDEYYDLQGEYYKGIIDAIYAHKDSISALIFWGVTDDRSWRYKQQPLIFTEDYKAKPAYYAIMEGREEVVTTTTTFSNTTTTTTTTVTDEDTTTETTTVDPTSGSLRICGDANLDKEVNMADAVRIMQSIANPDKYELAEAAEKNADVDLSGDVTNKDALYIQQYKLGLLTSIPVTDELIVVEPIID